MIANCKHVFAIYFFLLVQTTLIFSQEDHLSYYPIHIGDWWKYKRIDSTGYPMIDTTYYTIKIIGDTIVNGCQYYKRLSSYFVYYFFVDYLRIDSLNLTIRKLSLSDTSESIIYYLDASEGDTLISFGEHVLYCYSEEQNEIFGEERNVKYFKDILSWLVDITYSLCGGIGLVYLYDDSHGVCCKDFLIAAYIDSILYGNPSVVINENNNQTYMLYHNYPNPFNSTTRISYYIPKSSYIKLSIYDINGRLIETLVNKWEHTGYHSVTWNAANISSGIYLYKFDADEFSGVKKCLIVK